MARSAKGESQASLSKSQWRGKSTTRVAIGDHRWQDEGTALRGQPTRRRTFWRRVRVGLLLLAGLVGVAGLLALLWQREVQFPFVTLVKTAYRAPFPPNAWAREDLESLRSGPDGLDDKTIDVIDLSDADRTLDSLLFPSPEEGRRIVNHARRTGVIAFYVSLHGLVDDAGQACVAHPESTTWLPVSHLLREIRDWDIPDRVHKLLILDCNHLEDHWNIGLVENEFAARLQHALDEMPVPNLVILNSTSPGQTGWASPELRGTVFGQFLRLGMAGAADLPQEGGNSDRRVSLRELHKFLVRRVDGWARANRGSRQQPLLVPAAPDDYFLTCTLDPPSLTRLLSKFASDAAAEPNVPRGNLDELWSSLARLREQEADSLAPLEMSDLRHRLVWLERASSAGAAYRLAAHAGEREWRRLAERLSERLARPVSRVLAPRGAAHFNDAWLPGLAGKLRSLSLLARMGRVDPAAVDALATALKQLQTESSFEKVDALLTEPETKDLAGSVAVAQFLRLLRRSQRLRSESAETSASLGAAVELHTLADDAATPSDPRASLWLRRAVDAADIFRRTADDILLTGGTNPAPAESAKEAYREATAIDGAVRESFALCDQIAAELPDLARWLESPSREGAPAERAPDEGPNLLALITEVERLAASLDDPPESSPVLRAGDLPFLSKHRAVQTLYEQLRQRFGDACERLLGGEKYGPAHVREAAAILDLAILSPRTSETGLTPLEQRQRIQTLYSQACRDLHHLSLQNLADSGADRAADLDTAAAPSAPRPASAAVAALLQPIATGAGVADDDADGGIATSAAAGARFRKILNAVPVAIEAARKRHLASPDQPRDEWARAARLVRFAAPFLDVPGQADPVAELRRVDIQQLLLWQAGRYLDDFWGPVARGEIAFFDAASADALDAARAMSIPNPAVAGQIAALESRRELRRQASRKGLLVEADPLLLVDVVDRPAAHVDYTITASGRGLPSGLALMQIADHSGQALGPAVAFSVEPPAAEAVSKPGQIEVLLKTDGRELSDTIGAATAFFRGHEFADNLVIRTAAGTTVEGRPRQVKTGRVRLNGNRRQRASVVFVLDCSASMRKEMPFESASSVVPRMEVAKTALVRMMNALAANGDTRVGVLLYGHRVGWSTKEPNQLLTQSVWGGALPEGLKPYEDVETILPLGRFDRIAADKVAQRLEKVKPWGETPLYLALSLALQEFKDDDPDAQRAVVVITDGVNYQFNPRPEKAKTAQDVLAADSVRRIPLHIVGFGIQPDEAQQAQREFGQLAGATGGRYVPVSEAAALADTLEDILQRLPYSVISAAGSQTRAPLGTAVNLAWDGDGPQEYTVAIDALSEKIELAGGEALELFISQDAQAMLSAAYEAGAPIFAALIGGPPQDPPGVRLGIHQPVHEGTTVTFDLSLQQAQQRFVRRPREVWIEITPILGDNRPAPNLKYVIYEPEFVQKTPVPVIRATAHGWPPAARQARIDFWCKWTATAPSLVIPVSDLPDPGHPPAAPASLEGFPGLKYQAREKIGPLLQVDFIETYAPDSSGATMLKVEIAGPVLPARTLHQFDEANRFATHSFLFDPAAESALRAATSIRVSSRRRLLEDAWRLEVPALVEVPAQSDTLPSGP